MEPGTSGKGGSNLSESYTFQRRRIFRRRGSWSSRAGLTLVVLLGAIFGYLLPELLSSVGFQSPSFGEPAFGQVNSVSSTEAAGIGCEAMDCAGMRIGPMSLVPPAAAGRCKVSGTCTSSSVALGLEPESDEGITDQVRP